MNYENRTRAKAQVVTPENLDEIRDCLVLALDQLDSGKLDKIGSQHLIEYLHPAIELAQGRLHPVQ